MENINSVCFLDAIDEIKPIHGADNIEQAIVKGWSCVVKKGVFEQGDSVIVATMDAVIPQEIADKLGVTSYLRNGNRVRTVKLKGVYSECLLFTAQAIGLPHLNYHELGDDLTDILNIHKYEPPVKQIQLSSGKTIKYKENPAFSVYYKFPNCKNAPDVFNEKDIVQITRKIHGTNARYGIVRKQHLSFMDRVKKCFGNKWAGHEFVMGSHRVEKGSDSQGFYDTNVWYEIAKKYDIKNRIWKTIKAAYHPKEIVSFIIYGEIYGAGIQKGYDYGMKEIEFAVFDIELNYNYLPTKVVKDVCQRIQFNLNLYTVPVLYEGPWSKEKENEFVINNFIEGTKVPHEGIVVKSITGERNKVYKVINPDYLIYAEKHNVEDSH